MRVLSYFRCVWLTFWNITLYALTLGRFILLEGRVSWGRFHNWAHRFSYRAKVAYPTSEAELIGVIASSHAIRVVGSGHSFNDGVVSQHTLVSLDRYQGVVAEDSSKRQLRVRAGTRVRDLVAALAKRGWAFAALPSHDAQSIAGVLATDVHGTARLLEHGFVSQAIVALRLIDGQGQAHELTPDDELFQAVVGGVGAVGITVEVTIQAVEKFLVRQSVEISTRAQVRQNLLRDLEANRHLSLYLFPFTDVCQVNRWNLTQTGEKHSVLGDLREFLAISTDAMLAAVAGNFFAYCGLLPRVSSLAHSLKKGTDLVLDSAAAFNRTIYHLHQELEFTVPLEQGLEVAERFISLYEQLYRKKHLPYALFEIRFSAEGHQRSLLGAGRGRASCWIDLVVNDSAGFAEFYDEAEKLLMELGARPHLGKFLGRPQAEYLESIHGDSYHRFKGLVARHDPQGKFANSLLRRLFY